MYADRLLPTTGLRELLKAVLGSLEFTIGHICINHRNITVVYCVIKYSNILPTPPLGNAKLIGLS